MPPPAIRPAAAPAPGLAVGYGLAYALALAAALATGTGFALQQHAAGREPGTRFLRPGLMTGLLREPRWLAGLGCMVAGQLLSAWSVAHLELTLAEPLLATSLLFALVLSVPLSGQVLRAGEAAGALTLCAGVALLSYARSAGPAGLSFGSSSHWPAAAGVAAAAFAAVHAGRRCRGNLRAGLTGAAAGLVFGVQDALTRQVMRDTGPGWWPGLLAGWPVWALAGAGAAGLWLAQSAFSAGPLRASLPAVTAAELLAGMLLGVAVFGDRVQVSPGGLAAQAGGVAALAAGVIAVGRAPALSGPRRKPGRRRPAAGGASAPPRDTAARPVGAAPGTGAGP